jgi:hypothetical protein
MTLNMPNVRTHDIVKYSIETDDSEDVERMKSHLEKNGEIVSFLRMNDGAIFLVKQPWHYVKKENLPKTREARH